jgi:hypothetical protein
VSGDQRCHFPGDWIWCAAGDEHRAVKVLFYVGGADAAEIDGQFDVAGQGFGFRDFFESEVFVAVIDQGLHLVSLSVRDSSAVASGVYGRVETVSISITSFGHWLAAQAIFGSLEEEQ